MRWGLAPLIFFLLFIVSSMISFALVSSLVSKHNKIFASWKKPKNPPEILDGPNLLIPPLLKQFSAVLTLCYRLALLILFSPTKRLSEKQMASQLPLHKTASWWALLSNGHGKQHAWKFCSVCSSQLLLSLTAPSWQHSPVLGFCLFSNDFQT